MANTCALVTGVDLGWYNLASLAQDIEIEIFTSCTRRRLAGLPV
jgi:hypothetical protein